MARLVPGIRGSRPRSAVVAGLVAAAAVTVWGAGVSGRLESGANKDGSLVTRNATGQEHAAERFDLGAFCRGRMLRCDSLGKDRASIIYRSDRRTSQGFLLWDAGGPGALPLDAGAARAALPEWTQPFDLVVFPERWATAPLDRECLNGLRANSPAKVTQCPWGDLVTDVGEYRQLIASFEKRNGRLAGVYASSFGAVRSMPAIRLATSRRGFAVVESPAPRPQETGRELVDQRLAAARFAVVRTPSCPPRECRRRERLIDRLLREQGTVLELAVLGMAYDLSGNADFLAELWRRDGVLTRVGQVSLRRVASRFSLVTGSGAALEARAGYLAGTCAMYSGWTGSVGAFAGLHDRCSEVPQNGYRAWLRDEPMAPQMSAKVLLVINKQDPVVPLSFQEQWRRSSHVGATLTFAERGHVTMPDRLNGAVARWIAGPTREFERPGGAGDE